jgi:ubiquinone/menaquinone biosynthesis C-methylase UbiE
MMPERRSSREWLRPSLLSLALVLATGCQGVGKLDWTTLGRGTWQRPEQVVESLEIGAGAHVADVGSGDGYFVPYLADAVGEAGRVYAVDVEREITRSLEDRFVADTRVEVVLGGYEDPKLPDGAIDLVLLVNSYHHIEDRPDYFRRLQRDLAPGGRVAILEPNEEITGFLSLFLDEGHTNTSEAVASEMGAAGYLPVARHDFLPIQIFEVFAPEQPSVAWGDASPAR